jgi:hypothetical protein
MCAVPGPPPLATREFGGQEPTVGHGRSPGAPQAMRWHGSPGACRRTYEARWHRRQRVGDQPCRLPLARAEEPPPNVRWCGCVIGEVFFVFLCIDM